MKALGAYDGSLQMFVERPRQPDPARLRFLRWLAERGDLEHAVAGPPTGMLAEATRPNVVDERTSASERAGQMRTAADSG